MNWNSLRKPLLGAVIVASMGLAACSGGGGSSTSTGYSATCSSVSGVSDPLQGALEQLSAAAGAIPEAGGAAGDMAIAISALTDAVDAVAQVIQEAAATQDPNGMYPAANEIGDQLSCSLDDITASLGGVPLTGTPLDSLIETALSQIEDLQELLASNPLSGDTGLADLTGQVASLGVQLALIASNLPLGETGVPELQLMTAAMSASLLNFATLVNEFGQLDEVGTANALMAYYTQLASLLSTDAVNDLPVPVALPVATLIAQVNTLASGVVPQLQAGLIMILGAVFDALETVLAGGTPASTDFQEFLLGMMANSPISGDFATLIASLAGGTGGAPALSDLLGGFPVLGDLVATALGDSTTDPSVLLMQLLAGGVPTDVVGVPATLAGVLADLPGLSFITTPLSAGELSLLTDALETLVEEAGGGLPGTGELSVIEDLLGDLGGQFTTLNLGSVTTLVNLILGDLIP